MPSSIRPGRGRLSQPQDAADGENPAIVRWPEIRLRKLKSAETLAKRPPRRISPRQSVESIHCKRGERRSKFAGIFQMKRPLPRTPAEWLEEIELAIADDGGAEPFSRLAGQPVIDANLYHLAPLVCLKSRGGS